MADPTHWSAWFGLDPAVVAGPDALAETLDGGQAFTWRVQASEPASWEGTFGRQAARIRIDAASRIEAAVPTSRPGGNAPAATRQQLADYFRASLDWAVLRDDLPWRSDPVIAEALEAFPGLRLLDQPVEDALLGFLCSSTKQIVQIQQSLGMLAERYGPAVGGGLHALPDWATLATLPESTLRSCLLGYRARYVAETAAILAGEPGWATSLAALPTDAARSRLMALPGVGRKIADCVLLFGLGRLEVFPVDTWILRVLRERYGLDGWKAEQLLQFAEVHFGRHAGYAQQVLFAQARRKRTGRGQ